MNEETVSLIASGYEWECPECGEHNTEMEWTETVYCKNTNCDEEFKTDPPDHAYG